MRECKLGVKIFPVKLIRIMYTLCLHFLISHVLNVLHSTFQPHHFTVKVTNGLCLAKSRVYSSPLFTLFQQHLTLTVTFFVLELRFITSSRISNSLGFPFVTLNTSFQSLFQASHLLYVL